MAWSDGDQHITRRILEKERKKMDDYDRVFEVVARALGTYTPAVQERPLPSKLSFLPSVYPDIPAQYYGWVEEKLARVRARVVSPQDSETVLKVLTDMVRDHLRSQVDQ